MNRLEGAAAVSAHPREHANAEIAELETDSSLSLSALNALNMHFRIKAIELTSLSFCHKKESELYLLD